MVSDMGRGFGDPSSILSVDHFLAMSTSGMSINAAVYLQKWAHHSSLQLNKKKLTVTSNPTLKFCVIFWFFRRRKEYREKGMAAMREEKTSVAFECFQKACDVSPEMASHVIKVSNFLILYFLYL